MRYLLFALALMAAEAQADAELQFSLHQDGVGRVTQDSWPGQYLLLTVGYLSCPDVCPTTLWDMASAMKILGQRAEHITPIFISIDPHRDTPANIARYAGYFDPKMKGLAGDMNQTKAVATALKATFGYSVEGRPVYPPLPDHYEVYHSAYVYLYDPQHRLLDVFGYGTGGDELARRIAQYLP